MVAVLVLAVVRRTTYHSCSRKYCLLRGTLWLDHTSGITRNRPRTPYNQKVRYLCIPMVVVQALGVVVLAWGKEFRKCSHSRDLPFPHTQWQCRTSGTVKNSCSMQCNPFS